MKLEYNNSPNTSEIYGGNMTIHKPTAGLYAGSFCPLHVGHLDIIHQACDMFDEVIVAQGINPQKELHTKWVYPLPVKRLEALGIRCTTYETLLTDAIKKWEQVYDVTLVRGLRNGSDLEYEQNLVAFLKGMYSDLKVAAFYCDPLNRHVSSSALRGIKKFSKEEYDKYVIKD